MTSWFIIFPILIIVAAGIIWFVVKTRATPLKRTGLAVGALFTFVGFAVVLFSIYYQFDKVFATSFQFYSYAALAPKGDPFLEHDGYTGRILMVRDVLHKDGQVVILNHPNPDYPTEVALYTPGKYIQAQVKDNIVTIPADTSTSLPRVIRTSLWWALTKDIFKVNQPVK